MTSDTLTGRLRRLKTLAEVVGAEGYAAELTTLLVELETRADEVTPALLSEFHSRLLDKQKKVISP